MRARILLLAVLAFALTAAPAHAGGSHLLKLYKVEQHVDLQGEGQSYTVSCHGSDYAIDGMWRMDAVDQDNEFTRLELLSSVHPQEVYPSSDSSYHFSFLPTVGGDVQIKLWVTCLGHLTEASQGHQHALVLHSAVEDGGTGYPSGAATQSFPIVCSSGFIAVQPGWRVSAGGAITPFRSYPNPTFRSWQWSWIVEDPGTVIHTYLGCLGLKTTTVNGHAHRIVVRNLPNFGGSQRHLPVSDNRREQQLDCGEVYKGMLGGWWVNDPFHVWFYGMEPRIKTRAYWFGNAGGGSDSVYLLLTCFKDKTT